jgi:dethiobiotin synthetase
MTAVFVTASGTDVGKTFVTAGLLRHYAGLGKTTCALKPVLSGFDPADLSETDSGILLAAQGQDVTLENIEAITPWRFAAALAPNMAARLEDRGLDFDAVVDFSRRAVDEDATLFIEGVGGVMAPLTDSHTVLDWMATIQVPVILVVGSYLGAISHALTAFESVRRRRLHIAAIVVSESENSTVPLEETKTSLARFTGNTPALVMPRAPDSHAAQFAKLARILESGRNRGENA